MDVRMDGGREAEVEVSELARTASCSSWALKEMLHGDETCHGSHWLLIVVVNIWPGNGHDMDRIEMIKHSSIEHCIELFICVLQTSSCSQCTYEVICSFVCVIARAMCRSCWLRINLDVNGNVARQWLDDTTKQKEQQKSCHPVILQDTTWHSLYQCNYDRSCKRQYT